MLPSHVYATSSMCLRHWDLVVRGLMIENSVLLINIYVPVTTSMHMLIFTSSLPNSSYCCSCHFSYCFCFNCYCCGAFFCYHCPSSDSSSLCSSSSSSYHHLHRSLHSHFHCSLRVHFTAIFIFTFFDCLQAAALFPSRRSINLMLVALGVGRPCLAM